MHEYPITQSIVRISSEEAEKHKANKVLDIKIVIGELSGLVPECIQDYFDILSKGTIVEGAALKIRKVFPKIHCEECNFDSDMKPRTYSCEKCGSTKVRISGGKEFYIDSMEVE